MRITSILLLLLFHVINSSAQTDAKSSPLVIGKISTIHSQILKEDRVLNIYVPDNYDAQKSYPVIYILDGSRNEDFLHVVGLYQFFNLMFQAPNAIVVGIANVDRKRDFTFAPQDKKLSKEFPTTGHSDKFIKFMAQELLPFIAAQYNTNAHKFLMGQSLGGLLATEILLKNPNLFTHYFITSPSLWWDDQRILKEAPDNINKIIGTAPFVYLAVGKGEGNVMMRDAEKLFQLIKSQKNFSEKVHFNLMQKENHATILHNSLYEGLLLLYPYKEPK